jgi:hypothetical protein
MRVIAGTYRSRPLVAPRGSGTRPTSDRLRETIFNILSPRIALSRFADLYAGTGAVGIEALSRGAAHVFFAEKAAPALAAIRANLSSLKIAHNFTIEDRGAGVLLERLAKAAQHRSPRPHLPRPALGIRRRVRPHPPSPRQPARPRHSRAQRPRRRRAQQQIPPRPSLRLPRTDPNPQTRRRRPHLLHASVTGGHNNRVAHPFSALAERVG